MAVAFDTLKAATRLQEEAGFDETKARVLVSTFAEGMFENLATKDDIAGVHRELATLATKEELGTLRGELATLATKEELAILRGEIATLATKEELAILRGEIATLATKEELAILRGEMNQTAATLRGDISKVQERLTLRLGATVAAAVAILVAVDKLL